MAGDATSLSLRPFPVADKKPKTISDFIGRINTQSGGFRDVTEAKIHDEIARQAQAGAPNEDADMSDGEEEDEEEEGADEEEIDPLQAREQVLREIDIATYHADATLNTVSLLLSKQNPTTASLTLNKQLRETVGIGTLGADRLERPKDDIAKAEDQRRIAVGWTLMDINNTRNSAEAACAFLQKEVDAENKYWEDVAGVQGSGWSICRMPQERTTLGVRFGFSESAAEFKANGLAPMRRNDDGSVQLDLGRLGGVSERLLVTYERDGNVVGRSTIGSQPSADAPLEDRVLEARNTLLAQELWFELGREARTLTALGVQLQGSTITFNMGRKSRIILELVSLDSAPSPDSSLPENETAEGLSLALHILLSYTHRNNEQMRTRPLPPQVTRSRGQQPYALLRPLIGRTTYLRNLSAATKRIGALTHTLQAAGLPSTFTVVTTTPAVPDTSPATQAPNTSSAAHTLVRNAFQPPEFTITLTLLDDVTLTVRGRTFLHPFISTYYFVVVPPSSPLATLCPPHKDGYIDIPSLIAYLRIACVKSITHNMFSRYGEKHWILGVTGTAIQNQEGTLELRFDLKKEQGEPAISLVHVTHRGQPELKEYVWKDNKQESLEGTLPQKVGQIVDEGKR
ncbi:subunit 17 of mediator complex-domain-containing protein [Emericellopsis atlantica]|uniref:Mediator of RNA polymerase II transcription subunit 17 n=1 Tax=Emericellopsis atlantica TaxID=2614577 RepID=A0A9P7ZVL6_9HYPO|nr:subunit 17 of mediator complex-domain-containing protein [Emericellopsis atlantica]KAG9258557.1 subunit 17 of mediator complex-domain-containing protein [Emericellopsis atlantica]